MKLNQAFNLHSHTYRCGHAKGKDEEYVVAAIEAGFTALGFSDHVFLPGLSDKRMRGDYELIDDYLNSIGDLQEKYKDRIQIYKAFEAEWYGPRFEKYYRELLESKKVDYLLLGQHCFYDDGFHFYGRFADKAQGTAAYCCDLIQGMESGLFLYVCHPDLFMMWHGRFDEQAYHVAKAIAEKSVETGVPLEVNMGPSRWAQDKQHLPYPYRRFWEVVAEVGAECVFGVDAHQPEDYAISDYAFFNRFAKELGLKMVDPRKKLGK